MAERQHQRRDIRHLRVVALALRLPLGAMLNFVSGTSLALGVDLRDGALYRPLIGELGFGGTRYFPL
jgi:hypothetical protein